jgi:hypothetical protein
MTAGQVLTSRDLLSPVDAIVVLGGEGSDYPRTRYAIHLFHQGDAPMVVLSREFSRNDGVCSPSVRPSSEGAQREGLPANATMIIYGAKSPDDDAVKLRPPVPPRPFLG